MDKVSMTPFAASIYETGLGQLRYQLPNFRWHLGLGLQAGEIT